METNKLNFINKIKTAGLNTRIMSTYTNDHKLLGAHEEQGKTNSVVFPASAFVCASRCVRQF